MEIHRLKTWPDEFWAMKFGEKRFDYRKNDRNFKVGDLVLLEEYEALGEDGAEIGYTGQRLLFEITYILDGAEAPVQYNLPAEYCIMDLLPVSLTTDPSDEEEDVDTDEEEENTETESSSKETE
jgi:hypothetical protein